MANYQMGEILEKIIFAIPFYATTEAEITYFIFKDSVYEI